MVNMDFVQQVAGVIITVSTIIVGIVRKQSFQVIQENATDVIKFVDRHYSDKQSDEKTLRFVYTVRNMIVSKLPKPLKFVVRYAISDKAIKELMQMYFTTYKSEVKVAKSISNSDNLHTTINSLTGTDINIPSFDFETLQRDFLEDKKILSKIRLIA